MRRRSDKPERLDRVYALRRPARLLLNYRGLDSHGLAMQLRETVEKYLQLGGGYGRVVALAAFGLPRAEAEKLFGSWDDDYHISRFFHFSREAGESFSINGFPQTHVTIDAEIQETL
jgi:hypothetical protein